ncbi:MAG: ATP-grasp domain-containing protein [Carboxylicivirga sp.]|jgi:biotin carboxylase|nr:ATP-grasp domain-containing protein [Carboxylicivirga sp.]
MNQQKKKLLVLPAIFDHIEIVNKAKRRGFHVITCDNQVDNIGHCFSNEFTLIDLLDHDSVLEFSLGSGIDAILSFSTDIGAIPASLVADRLGLPGGGYKAVDIMANKDKFRKFQKDNDFFYPEYQVVESFDDLNLKLIDFPVVIKPVDRAGSKGVFVTNSLKELEYKFPLSVALSFKSRVIVEKFINSKYKQIHGDVIVQKGEIVFSCLGDQIFNKTGGRILPIATTFPSLIAEYTYREIINQIQKFVTLVGYKNGGINAEIRVDNKGNIFCVELGPRFGGNLIPKTIEFACGIDLSESAIDLALGIPIVIPDYTINPCVFQLILRSDKVGRYKGIQVKNKDKFKVLSKFIQYKIDDIIEVVEGPKGIIGVFIIESATMALRDEIICNTDIYFGVKII